MLNARINEQKIWYALYEGEVDAVDEHGDFTGETPSSYGKVMLTRANLSGARGVTEQDIFGQDLHYSRTMSTAKMNLGIDERTILWDAEPVMDTEGRADPLTAKYRVAAIARGHYQVHYALRQMNPMDGDSDG
jgi:hypothetical protein